MPRRIRPASPIRHLSDAGCFASDGEDEIIALIDVSGRPGKDGRDGQSFHHPPRSPGTSGRRGGDATPAHHGQDAGVVLCALSYSGGDRRTGQLVIRGQVDTPADPVREIEQGLVIPQSGFVFIRGVGGDGGDGGSGGDGQPGSVGYRGTNATRYTRGTNGGPGGHGGNAGGPTDGADAGHGGLVNLVVDHRDLGLLMLMKGHLDSGNIGFAGVGGRGGRGGRGGPGGSSYHWTETRTYRDSQGKTQRRTVFRSNPGGVSGRNGRNGAASGYRAHDGNPGTVGRLSISVIGPGDRQTEYDSPFNLELVNFDVAREYGVLEPDSLVSIDNVVIRNCGGMPTPDNYTVRVYLDSDRWMVCDHVDLVMHRALGPGETHLFDRSGLRVRLGDYTVEQPRKRAFRVRHPVNPHARLESGIGRNFRQFENSQDVHLRFPIELTAIASLNSLAPGEFTRVIWAVKNVSQETFDQKYLYRAVQSSIRWIGGDLDTKHLKFLDHQETPRDIVETPFVKPIPDLRPGQSTVIEMRIGIEEADEIVPYQGFAIGVDLDLQRPKSSERHDQYRCVDYRKTFIRVSERYVRDKDSRFLLVANQRTTVNDIEKWTQLADYFGSDLDVWDVSYYGFLDLVRAVDKDKSLLEQWRGMTIIVPNNYYQTPNGTTVAFQQLAKSQFLIAAADFDINFYIVGDSRTGGESMMETSLIPVDSVKSPSQLKNQKDFLRSVKKWNKYIESAQEVVGGVTGGSREFADVSLGSVHEFDIEQRTILFQPKQKWLEKRAKKLARKLQKDDPLHRWVIVHRYDTGDTDTEWGFFKKRKVGKLEVRRTLDATKGSAVLFEVDGIDAIDRDFILSKANKHGIFMALKFEDKVDRFIRLVSERLFPRFSEKYVDRPLTDEEVRAIGSELVDSILVDIFNEQKVAREAKTWGRSGVRALTPKLNYLAERSLNYGVTHEQMLANESGMDLLYDLIANVQYMAEASTTVWDSALLPTSFFKRGRAVSKYMQNRTERIVSSIFGRKLSWWDKMTKPDDDYDPFGGKKNKSPQGVERDIADTEISKRQDRLRESKTELEKYSVAQAHKGLTYDPELLAKSVRVMSGEQYDQIVAQEARAAKHRYETERSVRAKREDLLVPIEQTKATAVETPGQVTTQQ
ncbi:MAG: hypothetical protein AB8B91_22330 [Rubripirellula sp.]